MGREFEVRFRVASPPHLSRQVAQAGGQLRGRYSFTDTVFRRPGEGLWDGPAVLRLREEWRPRRRCRLLLSVSAPRKAGLPVTGSVLPGGKACLYEGRRSEAVRVARALGFEPAFRVHHRSGRAWKLPGRVEVVLERVVGTAGPVRLDLGWWAEVAVVASRPADAHRRLRSAVRRLQLDPREAVPEGLPRVVARALGVRAGRAGGGSRRTPGLKPR